MLAHDESRNPEDSLDRVEGLLAIQEMLDERIRADASLSPDKREQLIQEIHAQFANGEFWSEDDWDDDALGVLVRQLGPKGPQGRFGAAVSPEKEPDDTTDESGLRSKLPPLDEPPRDYATP